MRLVLALCLLAAPAFAEDAPTVPKAKDEGFSLMEEGMKLVMRGMMNEMQPALDEMGKALSEMEPHLKELGPKLQQLITLIDDIKNYDAPVMLPNGDILIRRNAPLVPRPETLPQPGPNGEIEL
ncbi:AAA+ family ATPase [Tabrizicola sp.]|uniref:AAA+ family ATPase n=1 Tax=Tabrizicola sp. TaxID=2005166 RepID=UPI002FDDC317